MDEPKTIKLNPEGSKSYEKQTNVKIKLWSTRTQEFGKGTVWVSKKYRAKLGWFVVWKLIRYGQRRLENPGKDERAEDKRPKDGLHLKVSKKLPQKLKEIFNFVLIF